MTGKKFEKRLKEIFDAFAPPDLQAQAQIEAVEAPVSESFEFKPRSPSPRQSRRTAPFRVRAHSGWNEFLDGIRRTEQLGYSYQTQSDEVQPLNGQGAGEAGGLAELVVPVKISGSPIGSLQLEREAGQRWSKDDADLINGVLARLTQQLETLQLIDEADRSRTQAEQAVSRLTRQSDASAPDANPAQNDVAARQVDLSFEFDQQEVRPAETPPDQIDGLHVPLRSGELFKGHLAVELAPDHELTPEDTSLVQTVAQRLSQQVQNLRFLEESRHYREQSEHAIQDLTRDGWEAYFTSSGLPHLTYQYDRSLVQPLPEAEAQLIPDLTSQPLAVRDQPIGWFGIQSDQDLTTEDNTLVNVIGDRLATHLEGLRLAAQREQALSETELLYRISARLSTAQTLDEALTSVSEPAAQAGARDSRLYIINLDEAGQPESLSLAAVWYPDEGTQVMGVETRLALADYPGYTAFLHEQNDPILVADLETSTHFNIQAREILEKSGARALAALPLTISGRWVGVVFIHWDHPHHFTDREQRLYSTLARQAAVVVNNRMLLEQTRKRAAELQTVAQVSTAASSILDPQELLQTVVDLARTSFNLYHVQVYRYDYELNALEVAAGSGTAGSLMVASGILTGITDNQAPVSRAVRSRQMVIMNDSQLDPGFVPNPILPQVRAEINIPLLVGERLMGVFSAMSDTPNRFSREDARTFQTLASQISVALQNAELYAEQAVTVDRLRELDHLKSSFMSNMSHELRTPLNSILGFAEVLLLELDGPLTEQMTNDISLIQKNGKHLLNLINEVLDMSKIEAGKMSLGLEKFQLRELITETMEITASLAQQKGLYFRIAEFDERVGQITADRTRMRQVIINIISNAVKFTPQGGIGIYVDTVDEEHFRIRIKDTGMGIPPDKLEMIFEAFSQVDTSTTRKVGGTGLGLPISRRLVQMHGGKLWAESTGIPGEGSTFIIELPFVAVKPN